MVNMTLALPEELHDIMQRHKEIKWSEVARKALWDQAKKIEFMHKLLSQSTLTEKDAERIGNKVKRAIAKKHGL